jgi:hypothetical protein
MKDKYVEIIELRKCFNFSFFFGYGSLDCLGDIFNCIEINNFLTIENNDTNTSNIIFKISQQVY